MKKLALAVSGIALLLTIVPPILFFTGSLEDAAMKAVMLAGTLLWFVAWPVALKDD